MIAQTDKTTPERDARLGRIGLSIGAFVAGAVVFFICYSFVALNVVPPRTTLDGVPIGLTTRSQALERYETQTAPPPPGISITVAGAATPSSTQVSAQELHLQQNPEASIDLLLASNASSVERILLFTRHLFSKTDARVAMQFDESVIEQRMSELAQASFQPSRDPSVTLGKSGDASTLVVDRGSLGASLDATAAAMTIKEQLGQKNENIVISADQTGSTLSEETAQQLSERANFLVGKQLSATAERLTLSLNDVAIVALLDVEEGWNNQAISNIVTEWQKQTGSEPQNPTLVYDPTTLAVTTFTPPRNGRLIEIEKTNSELIAGLDALLKEHDTKTVSKELVLVETAPTTSLESLNSLGLKERIGYGESQYAHSIPNRIHNVAITTERVNNIIIPPGAEFSFNKTIGDVSAATGYRSAYVIKNGRTEQGDGGGVCQVSTTLFRSVMNAGLLVTKRLPHSYRVSYYELDSKPGADATVYAGDVDFRFKNDTPNHILVHAVADSKNTAMYVELYGTSDGRHAEIVEHKTWDARPALAPEYFPDPSLPPGKVVQIDWAAPGIRASITNVIYDKDNNEVRRDTYVSNYRPWSAKYLQGV